MNSMLKKIRRIFKKRASLLLLIFSVMSFYGCTIFFPGDQRIHVSFEHSDTLLLVVDAGLYPYLKQSVEQYSEDLGMEGYTVIIAQWDGGVAADLKNLLEQAYTENNIDGALLVGDFPSFWYERYSFGREEEFPCDLYFMDFDAQWLDTDGDGIYDSHSALNLEIFISRISGNYFELKKYFSKVHAYRAGEVATEMGAYIFKDDDWEFYNKGSNFGLNSIYTSVEIIDAQEDTLKSRYLSNLSEAGAEYVYQWMHSYPPLLLVENDTFFEYIFTSDIAAENLKGLFYNLFNCSASRFTEDNLAMSYLMETDYGLATIGSTKVGGNYRPEVFHFVLSRSGSWGDAYKTWYNNEGSRDDQWFMGMVILGDPMLKVSKGAVQPFTTELPTDQMASEEEREELVRKITKFARNYEEGSFLEYRSENPQYFRD